MLNQGFQEAILLVLSMLPKHIQFSSPPIQWPASGSSTLIESLSVPEPENLQVANTLVDASKTCFLIQVVNPFPRDV